MRLNLNQIETLYWTVRLSSFQAAAQHLNLTQPTISIRIRELETLLGEKLLERSSKGVNLTAAGADIFADAERMLRLADDIQERKTPRDPLHGVLRIGVVESVALLGLAESISAIKEECPALEVSVTVDVGTNLNEAVKNRELDIAILTDPEERTYLTITPLGQINMQWIVSPRLGLGTRVVRPSMLENVPILTHPAPSTMNSMIHAWFHSSGCQARFVSTCNSFGVMARFAIAGHGATLLSPAVVKSEIASGILQALGALPNLPPRTMFCAYLNDKYGPNLRRIVEILRSVIDNSALLLNQRSRIRSFIE